MRKPGQVVMGGEETDDQKGWGSNHVTGYSMDILTFIHCNEILYDPIKIQI